MRPLTRVLMTADAVGGVWSYSLQLAGLLAGRGVQVVLATMGPGPADAQREEASRVAGLELRTSTFALEWMQNPWSDLRRAGSWLLELEREIAPDVIHLNGYAHAALSWQAPVLIVAHSCVASWWNAVHRSKPPVEWDIYIQTVRAGLLAADRIAAPTRAMRDALVRFYGAGADATIIHNCRPANRWQPAPKEPFVLSAGRAWDEAKNIATLDAAAEHLPWPVRVAGATTGPASGDYRPAHIDALGLLSPEDLAQLMGRAAIYALPARYEPFGLSVLEAALSGCALVLGDIQSLRENWNGVAKFVAPDDVDGLRRAIRELIEYPAERDELAHAARRRAELFSPEQHRDAYYALYEEMAAAGRQRVVA